MGYDIDMAKKGDLVVHTKKFFLHPKYWSDPSKKLTEPTGWKGVKFTKVNRSKIPRKNGVYCFILKPKVTKFVETRYLFYVGLTNRTLWERYKEYLDEQAGKGKPRAKVYQMFKQYSNHLYFYYTEIANASDVENCEEKLINTFVPLINTSIPEAKISPELKNLYEG